MEDHSGIVVEALDGIALAIKSLCDDIRADGDANQNLIRSEAVQILINSFQRIVRE